MQFEDAARMSEFHCSFDDPDYEAFVNALSRGERPPDDVSNSGLVLQVCRLGGCCGASPVIHL